MKDKPRIGFQSVVIVLLLVVIGFLGVIVFRGFGQQGLQPAQTVPEEERQSGKIGYATEGVVIGTDEDTLDAAIDKMMEEALDGVGVEYRVAAYSEDGINFDCYIGNPADSPRDKFIAIYGDATLTDELFVSGLIRPGEIFQKVTLNRQLEEGPHQLFVAFNDVEEDEEGEQTLWGQTVMVVTFNVI